MCRFSLNQVTLFQFLNESPSPQSIGFLVQRNGVSFDHFYCAGERTCRQLIFGDVESILNDKTPLIQLYLRPSTFHHDKNNTEDIWREEDLFILGNLADSLFSDSSIHDPNVTYKSCFFLLFLRDSPP